MDAEEARIKSQVLIESLPYLRQFHGQTVVVKYGGHAMLDDELRRSFARNIALLHLVGVHPVVVHGGGPQIGEMLKQLALPSEFRAGLRVTDEATMRVVEMVLVGSVNKDVVNRINQAGARAVGLSGKDGMLLHARKKKVQILNESGVLENVDLGSVGEVERVDTQLIHALLRDGFVPVIAPVGVDDDGRTYNINADDVAGAVAGALQAARFILLTDVPGVLDKDKNLLRYLTVSDAGRLLADGTLTGGMIPKINCCLDAVRQGVDKVIVADGRLENCVLLELLTSRGLGTAIVAE